MREFWALLRPGRRIVWEGRELVHDAAAELERDGLARKQEKGPVVGSLAYNGGLESVAMGCHRSQVEEYRAFVRDRGILGVEYQNNGVPKCTKAGRRNLMRALGFHDRDGGYGDG